MRDDERQPYTSRLIPYLSIWLQPASSFTRCRVSRHLAVAYDASHDRGCCSTHQPPLVSPSSLPSVRLLPANNNTCVPRAIRADDPPTWHLPGLHLFHLGYSPAVFARRARLRALYAARLCVGLLALPLWHAAAAAHLRVGPQLVPTLPRFPPAEPADDGSL